MYVYIYNICLYLPVYKTESIYTIYIVINVQQYICTHNKQYMDSAICQQNLTSATSVNKARTFDI